MDDLVPESPALSGAAAPPPADEPDTLDDHAARCRALADAGRTGPLVEASRAYADRARSLHDDAHEVEALALLATAAQRGGQFAVAVGALYRETHLRALNGDRVGEGLCLTTLGLLWSSLGAHEDALDALDQCWQLCGRHPELPDDLRAACSVALGHVSLTMARPAQALPWLEVGLTHARRGGDLETELGAVGMCGVAYRTLADFGRAQAVLTPALERAREHDLTPHMIDLADSLGQVHLERGALEDAHGLFENVLSWATAADDVRGRVTALLGLGRVAFQRTETDAARVHLLAALDLATAHDLHAPRLQILEALIAGLDREGRRAEAYPYLHEARELEREMAAQDTERRAQAVAARAELDRARRETELERQMHDASQALRLQAEETVRLRTAELEAVQSEIVSRLGLAAEYRDDQTGQHTRRVGELSASLARAMGLPQDEIDVLRWAARLHDIGKIGVGDDLLLKSGRYTPDEYERTKVHTVIGARVLEGSQSRLLRAAEEIALTHHERWDGTGYPRGLAGDGIPVLGRIVAVADVFDALTTERPYRAAWPVSRALDELVRQAGAHFDPQIVGHLMHVIHGEAVPARTGDRAATSSGPTLPDAGPGPHLPELQAMIDRAWALRRSDTRTGAELAQRAMELARQGSDDRVLGLAHRTQGYYAFVAGDYEDALSHLSQGMDLGVRLDDPGLQADCANFIAAVYTDLQDYARATDQLGVALRIAREHRDRRREAQLLHNLATLSYRNRDVPQAQQFVQDSLDLFRELGDLPGQEDALHTLAVIALDSDQTELAAQAAHEAVTTARETGNVAVMTLGLATAGKAAARLGDVAGGKELLREAIDHAATADLPTSGAWHRYELGRLHQEAREYGEARGYHLHALETAQSRGLRDLEMMLYQQLSEIAAHEERHADAFAYYRQHHELEREIHGHAATMRTRSMMSQLEVERAKSGAEIYRLRTIELARANEALERSNVEKSRLVTMLEEQSRLLERQLSEDGLTGLYNRRHIETLLQGEFTQARVTRRSLSVAMADIDHFKQINDRYSHLVGDRVLRAVAQLFRSAVRTTDSVGRYGGEEFLFVFPNTGLEPAYRVCERVQELVRAHDWSQIHPQLVVTLSIGVACEPGVANHEKLIAVADEHLYRAKHGGRDQIQAARPN